MCATFGDATDVEWYQKHGLRYKQVILPEGRIAGEILYIGGMKVIEARIHILDLLKAQGFLIKQEETPQSQLQQWQAADWLPSPACPRPD